MSETRILTNVTYIDLIADHLHSFEFAVFPSGDD